MYISSVIYQNRVVVSVGIPSSSPTLFIHSDEDYRCPLEQGLQMFTALKERGISSRLCLFHGENHELSRSGKPLHRIRRLQEIQAWLDEHCCAGRSPVGV